MSYLARLVVLSPFVCLACSAPPTEAPARAGLRAASSDGPTLSFTAAWRQWASQPLVAGAPATIEYDTTRLPDCRGDLSTGHPGWSIEADYSVNGILFSSVPIAGAALQNVHPPAPPSLTPPFAGDLQVWFVVGSAWGCQAWDSAYGANYHFPVAAPANAPGWLGNAAVLIDRATCGSGGPCYGDAHPAGGGFTFDTWARQRAAVTQFFFEVWRAGVTDFANPDLWRQLDVELHSRIGGVGDFKASYIDFAGYTGNNARYAVDLRALDPLPGENGGPLTNISQCPSFSYSLSADGQLIQADVEYYVTVNGVALQPSGGGLFHGLYQNYAGLYSVCLPATGSR